MASTVWAGYTDYLLTVLADRNGTVHLISYLTKNVVAINRLRVAMGTAYPHDWVVRDTLCRLTGRSQCAAKPKNSLLVSC